MRKKNLLIAGSQGLIGTDLVDLFSKSDEYNIELMDIQLGTDFTNQVSVENAFKDLSQSGFKIEYIINSFGKNHHIDKNENPSQVKIDEKDIIKDLNKLENEVIYDYFNVNVMAIYNLVKGAIQFHSKSLKSFTTLGSLYSDSQPFHPLYDEPKSLGYVISKHSLVGLNNYLASYFGKYGIRFNIVSPGCIISNQSDIFKGQLISRTPMGRLSVAEDLFGLLKLLSSEGSQYMTGLNIKVDGGLSLY